MTVLPDPPFERHEPIAPAPDDRASGTVGGPGGGRRRFGGRLATFVAGLVVMLSIVLVIGALRDDPAPLSREEVAQAIDDALASQTPAQPRAELVYAAIGPSIIAIETEGTDREGLATSGTGTGVLVSDQGEVLTALHVVEGATTLTLRFADGTVGTGSVTSEDPANDIAVVTADSVPQGVPPATLGNPGSMRIGSDAYIVGNPFGLRGSLSSGVVSGLDRAFRNPDTDAVQNGLIQVDAAVNPGNSGGPLLDNGGRVVGIVTALINPTDQRVFIGIGLAVPIDVAGGGAGLPPSDSEVDVYPVDPVTAPGSAPGAVPAERLLYEVKKVIVGQDHLLERMVVALLARGHLLVEGVPGLAKTMAIKTVAQAVGGDFKRIQFTPDLVPSDLVGTRIYNQKTGEFTTSLGPVFTNLLLADEINRAPAKVQSALLEVMQERQVTIGGETHVVPDPFLVLATQNPIETEGTYALPEAQVDRFMLKVLVGYPSPTEEYAIVERMTGTVERVREVLSTGELVALQRTVDAVYVDPALYDYAVRLAVATRMPDRFGMPELKRYITYGASPRASINLILTARALAFVRGRTYALPEDVLDMAVDVMRHRLVLSYEALSDAITPDRLLSTILGQIAPPVVPLRDHAGIPARA